jgi:glycosyltransferase involved in cell wall biosynthesis
MSKRPTIALSCIAKNESENVERMLKSWDGCVDAIYFTDTGSTDNTVEIAKKCGAIVSHFEWVNDFSAARNFNFDQIPSSFDYIVWCDLDDVLENPEGFKLFRDNVMGLYDYHVATYHYASDATGKSVCSFVRERVFRASKGLRWKYFVHEGVIPVSSIGSVSVNYSTPWAIRHMRTAEDLKKDARRNLDLFATNLDSLDARMIYYYGKELFESGDPKRAINELLKAVSRKELEPHDRILATQYLAYAYGATDQWERAIDVALTGIQFAPQRAEFHCTVSDGYVKLGRLADAIPFYNSARACQPAGQSGPYAGPIFVNLASYGEYPTNQLARVFANLGQFEKASEEARRAVIHFNSAEADTLLQEIKKLQSLQFAYKNAKCCDEIVISTAPANAYEFDPGKYKTKAMGGSETALIEMADALSRFSDKKVRVFNMREKSETFGGVEYLPTSQLAHYMAENKPYLHIAWRHNIKVTDAPTFVWSHDLMTPGAEDHHNYQAIMALTPFHMRFLMATQGVPENKIYVTRNGIKPSRFLGGQWAKNPDKFVFGSSPDRGLDRAMLVLDEVRKVHPEIKLHVFYGIEHLDNYGRKDLREHLKSMMDARKEWVVYHGAVEQNELMRHYKEASYHVQPSDWIETSCIQAKELACCGIHPIFRAVGGVVDTLSEFTERGEATVVDSDCITPDDFKKYVSAVLSVMESSKKPCLTTDQIDSMSWDAVALEWLRDLPLIAGLKT